MYYDLTRSHPSDSHRKIPLPEVSHCETLRIQVGTQREFGAVHSDTGWTESQPKILCPCPIGRSVLYLSRGIGNVLKYAF